MKNKLIFFLVLCILLTGCATVTKKNAITGQVVYEKEYYDYINKIDDNNLELKALSKHITEKCQSKTCSIFALYRHIVLNYEYEQEQAENIQEPHATYQRKKGDCEDLSILLISMLESIDIKTYFVISDNHAYALSCDVDKDELISYIRSFHSSQEIFITYYDVFGYENCIVLDATAGAEGYPGYDAGIKGAKAAVDISTGEEEILE